MVAESNSIKNVENDVAVQTPIEGESLKVFTIKILHIIKDAQQQHGLRHGDYQRYRGYCSRRIRRLRKALKFPQGDKRHYKRRDVTLDVLTGKRADERFVHIPLINAERCWAYAMQLKQESNTEPRKRYHLITKLRKACSYSLYLQELCNCEAFNARTKLECEAYVSWMHGTLYFELQRWKIAGDYLKKAQVVYENLRKALPEDEQELYLAKANEFTPNLRYCAYNRSGGCVAGGNMDDLLEFHVQGLLENLDDLVNKTKSENNDGFVTTEWRGRKVTIRPQKVRLFLLSNQELDKSLERNLTTESKIELIERTLMDCKDAIQAVKEEMKQDHKLRSSSGVQAVSAVQYLLAYLSYVRLSRTLQRNLCLIEQCNEHFEDPNQKSNGITYEGKRVRAQDLTRLYEIALQNITEMQQINGMEDDLLYQSEVENLSRTFKAFRCYYIALTLINMKKWKEAVSLYERALNYAEDALKGNSIEEFNNACDLKKLIYIIDSCKYSVYAYSVLEHGNLEDPNFTLKSQKLSKPVFERLSQYKEEQSLHTKSPNVFKVSPDMEVISCKPLFFDLALNYFEFPTLNDKPQSDGNKGISGFVKGFFGWRGNK